ncbi:MAG: hypothetical protein JO307_01800 [Bryobacterales bacterium]|nr:hypothetical protein [Bryobacterales bacterium]
MFFAGLDLGQREDFSAIAVVEREEKAWGARGGLLVRYLERMPLGTPYTKVVERVCGLMRHRELAGRSRLVVDATGVGAPVVEMLGSAGLAGIMTAVTITGGAQAHGRGEKWHVPRRDLLMNLEVLMERGELTICRRLGEAERLTRELTSVGARGESGEHDDLAMSVALACWRARGARSAVGSRRLPGI